MVAEPAAALNLTYAVTSSRAQNEALLKLQTEVHERLLADTDLQDLQRMSRTDLLERIGSLVGPAAEAKALTLTARSRQVLLSEVFNEIRGFGPIQTLLEDPTISEVMVNGPRMIFVERQGKV